MVSKGKWGAQCLHSIKGQGCQFAHLYGSKENIRGCKGVSCTTVVWDIVSVQTGAGGVQLLQKSSHIWGCCLGLGLSG